jgi:hypothetical protein
MNSHFSWFSVFTQTNWTEESVGGQGFITTASQKIIQMWKL